MDKEILVCEQCGSKKIQTLAWVDANTNKYVGEFSNEKQDNWCENCEEHVYFTTEETYNQNQDD